MKVDIRTRTLCENVFEIAQVAMCLVLDDKIVVENQKELFYCALDWAQDFEETFNTGEYDYYSAIQNYAAWKLKEAFSKHSHDESEDL